MRGGYRVSKFSEYQGYSDRANYIKGTDIPSWMKGFASNAENFVKSEQENSSPLGRVAVTIVNHSRERDEANLYQNMYSIMNGSSPRFSSVDEKVRYYQEKTGLKDYLKKIQADLQIKEAAQEILQAVAEDDSEQDDSEGLKKKDYKTPIIFEEFPGIEASVREVAQRNHLLPIPAIINIISENLSNSYVRRELLLDENLYRYINDVLSGVTYPQYDSSVFFTGEVGEGSAISSTEDPFSTLRGG